MNLKTTVIEMLPGRQWDVAARWAPVPLRLIGMASWNMASPNSPGARKAFATILHAIGVPAPHLMAWSTILIEVLGGLAVILGAFVTLVSVPMAVVLLVAVFTVHLPYGFSSIKLMAVTAAGAQFGRRVTKLTCCTSLASRPLSWEVLGPWRWMA